MTPPAYRPFRDRGPWIIAHRGASRKAPENSQAAFDQALADAADGIEMDIQLTRDAVPVIYHDRTLAKINGRRRRVSDYSYDELCRFDWGVWFDEAFRGESLMTFEQAIQRYHGDTRLFIEIKSRPRDRESGRSKELTDHVLRILAERVPEKFRNNIYILSFDADVLAHASRVQSEWNYILNVDTAPATGDPIAPDTDIRCGLCLRINQLTMKAVQTCRQLGLPVFTYPCNVEHQLRKALATGVDGILTDDPRRTRTILDRWSAAARFTAGEDAAPD